MIKKILLVIQSGAGWPFSKENIKVVYWSEIVRNINESELYHLKWLPVAILYKILHIQKEIMH